MWIHPEFMSMAGERSQIDCRTERNKTVLSRRIQIMCMGFEICPIPESKDPPQFSGKSGRRQSIFAVAGRFRSGQAVSRGFKRGKTMWFRNGNRLQRRLGPGLRFSRRGMRETARTGAVKDWKYSRNQSPFLIDSGEYFARICLNQREGKQPSFDDQILSNIQNKFLQFFTDQLLIRKL